MHDEKEKEGAGRGPPPNNGKGSRSSQAILGYLSNGSMCLIYQADMGAEGITPILTPILYFEPSSYTYTTDQ